MFEPVNESLKIFNIVAIQMKATKQYFPVVLFIMLYKVVLTFKSAHKIPKCDHSNESYWAVLSGGGVCTSIFSKGFIFFISR